MGNVAPNRITAADARKRWPAKWPVLGLMSDGEGTRHKLAVVALYWTVKRMVIELAVWDGPKRPQSAYLTLNGGGPRSVSLTGTGN
jgi:hypothetical protein